MIHMTAAAVTISTGDIRLTRRGRLLATISAVLFLLASVFALATSGAEASNTLNSAPAIEIVVSPGDTLWSIAKAVSPQADPRVTIYEIKAMNLIEGNSVYPGQIIRVPGK
jgi:LysM repeat protein